MESVEGRRNEAGTYLEKSRMSSVLLILVYRHPLVLCCARSLYYTLKRPVILSHASVDVNSLFLYSNI